MIVIRYREDPTSAIITASAIVLMIGSLAFMLLAPRPTAASVKKKQDDRVFKAQIATDSAQKKAAEATVYIGTHSWSGTADDVSPAALARVSGLARQQSLNLISFRPQRTSGTQQVPQLPFQATVEGAYPQVLAFTRALETTGSRLVVTSVMMSSSDASSDRVTASIGLLAFINPATPPAKPASTTTTVEVKTNA